MIKFFRRIRQRLLSESKISKYLIYALGEILLVVIGILIALQINLWNEQRKEKSKECEYFSSLLSDLQDQITAITSQMEFESEVIRDGEALIDTYYATNNFQVNENFSRQIGTLNNRMTFRGSSSTYQELLSTGSMSIISDRKIRVAILEYYQKLAQFEGIIANNNNYIDNHFAPYFLEISTHQMPNAQINMFQQIIAKGLMRPGDNHNERDLPNLYREIQQQLDEPLRKLKVLNDIKYRYRISGVHLSIMDELKDQSVQLGSMLEEKIKECSIN